MSEALDYLPLPLVIVTAGDIDNPRKRGGMAAAWVCRVSWEPPLFSVAFAPTRYTYELIKEFREFAINVVPPELEEVTFRVFGSMSGREVDKFEVAKVRIKRGRRIRAPVLEDALAIIECIYESEFEAGDHIVVIGRAIDSYVQKPGKPLVWV